MRDVLEIRNLVLRLPGVDRHDAARIAEEVAERLAEELPEWRGGEMPARVDLRVRVPRGARRDELPALIAGAIARSLS